MSKGKVLEKESIWLDASVMGCRVRQVTSHPSIHHHPFFYIPAYDDRMRWLVFVSHRTGSPQIYVEERSSGRLIQATHRQDLNEWSVHPSHDGRYVYFTAGHGAWRVDLETFQEKCLADFGNVPMIPPGMVGDAMGTTAVSADDRWWAIPVKTGSMATFYLIDTSSGHCAPILEAPVIGHPQFHPKDSTLLHYGGAYHSRLWVVNRDGSGNRLLYERDVAKKEWMVHEVWNPLDRELLSVNWPHGVIGIHLDTGLKRWICRFNAWHPMVTRDGRRMVCDTTFPDRGLFWFEIEGGDGAEPVKICDSLSSNEGRHWNRGHCPYDDGPVSVYAPQHTHPHPHPSPDGSRVVFTSDRTGVAQLYEVDFSSFDP